MGSDKSQRSWSHLSLRECGRWLSGGTPSTDEVSYWNGDIPWITASSLHNFQIKTSERKITELGLANGSRLVPNGSILFVVRGMSLKTEFRVGITQKPVAFGQDCKAIIPNEGIDPLFLAYALRSRSEEILGLVDEAGHGTGRLQTDLLENLPIQAPPLTEQKAITAVLGALDDKIELNWRMNATLEAMARALFQSWFIDFDPVRRNVDRNQPSPAASRHPLPVGEGRGEGRFALDPTTAALFPASFQDSPIGPVPKGWKVERFDAHITADRGLSYKGEGLREDGTGLPMHNLNSVYEGGGYKHDGLKYYAGGYREKHLLEPGDMIVTNTEQGFDHLLIGHAAIVPRCYGPKGLFSHHIYRVRFKPSSPFSPHYLVELFNNRRWHYWISGFSNGTTINMLPMDALEMPMLVVPPVELVNKFTALAEAAHIQVEDNKQQSRTLATLRDTLLPKLLSGELSVASVEKEVSA